MHMYTLQEDSMVHVWREHSTLGGGRGWDALPSSAGAVGDMVSPTQSKLQLLDTCRGARCLDCVTDDATHLAVTDQVSHRLQ